MLLCEAFGWLIQESQYSATPAVVGYMALFAANRKDAGVEPVAPLSSYMEVSTVKKYCGVWKQVLCYI